jgi:hypothetical protein
VALVRVDAVEEKRSICFLLECQFGIRNLAGRLCTAPAVGAEAGMKSVAIQFMRQALFVRGRRQQSSQAVWGYHEGHEEHEEANERNA